MISFRDLRACVVLLLSAAALASCAAQSGVRNASLPSTGPPEAPPEYRLGFGDIIEVKFFNNERFNETVTVRPDGRITLEKVGDVLVAGMSPSRLDSLITAAYARILQNPEVTVFVRRFGGYQVYVLGEVNSPGGYPLEGEMTILQSIATAKGTKRGAKLASVIVLRRGADESGKGFMIDLTPYISGNQKTRFQPDLSVRPGDIIYVPQTAFSNFNEFTAALWGGALKPLEIFINAAAFTFLQRQ